MKHIAILCGGSSYEHEVSIVTGIQVAQAIDRTLYTFSFVYFDKHNNAFLIKDYAQKKDFKRNKRIPVSIIRKNGGAVLQLDGFLKRTIAVDAFYLAFHGGSGESGQIQGLLELYDAVFTSASQEGSVISMNKSLTKEVLRNSGISVLPSHNIFSSNYAIDSQKEIEHILQKLSLPVIIKPVHLGSSIAISIAHTDVELEKYLNVATKVDNEILLEPALQSFTEYNISVRTRLGQVELSPIEEPKRKEEFLSFEDKYSNGSKKTGGKQTGGGMELLDRTVPAKIAAELEAKIQDTALKVYQATRLSGLVRIDFIYHEGELYCSEINPIPGSMSFYLWEASGEQFKQQITFALEDAFSRHAQKIAVVPYQSDIVDKFVGF